RVEPAVREPGALHHVGDADAFVAVLADGARRGAQDALAGLLLLGNGLDFYHMTSIIFQSQHPCQAKGIPVDKIKPLYTASATAVGGRNGHTETSDGIVKA